uniref:Uncharacterized protein n=1 Tax=Tanacetum cinerariifolium TaxID=118510 RepID=A0A699IQF1_TANCI|nr:hypothetical protein [Tanacetum cinerariifolium]
MVTGQPKGLMKPILGVRPLLTASAQNEMGRSESASIVLAASIRASDKGLKDGTSLIPSGQEKHPNESTVLVGGLLAKVVGIFGESWVAKSGVMGLGGKSGGGSVQFVGPFLNGTLALMALVSASSMNNHLVFHTLLDLGIRLNLRFLLLQVALFDRIVLSGYDDQPGHPCVQDQQIRLSDYQTLQRAWFELGRVECANEDATVILARATDYDSNCKDTFMSAFGSLFTKSYPYIKKLAASFRLPLGDLQNICPEGKGPTVGSSAANA